MKEFTLEQELRNDVIDYVYTIFNAHHHLLSDALIDEIVSDVRETSAFEEGYYSEGDIHIGFERVILEHMGIEI